MIRPIYIYLYRYRGEPRYVGQTPNVERRDRDHVKAKRKSSFEAFLAEQGREKFTLELIGQVEDVVLGAKANALSPEHLRKLREAANRPERRAAISARLTGLKRSPEAVENNRLAQLLVSQRPESKERFQETLKKMLSPEAKAKSVAARKITMSSPEYRKRRSQLTRLSNLKRGPRGPVSEEARANIAAANRVRTLGVSLTQEQKDRIRELMGNPLVRARISIKARLRKPSFIDCWESQHLLAPAA